ncbi:FAD-dependent monooxygenase [Nocardia sp. BMG51109]|uniref:FAD-dependent monooxygenase n=1 Tax=Nocardia sp. BMG51109 TaxID=1056816 RepID=UPI000462FB3D|nr:FAD-dependent monooxygenase [Nocardia sp. BMG51109]
MATVLVVGGGIGGLATALSVASAGFDVTVWERSDVFAELGAGIQLAPNAFHALDRLGVGTAVRDRAVLVDELRLMDAVTGEPIVRFPLTGAYRERFGNPYSVVHRGDLYQPLLDASRDHDAIELCGGRRATGYEEDDDGVTVFDEHGHSRRGDLLIGADGIRSTIRRALLDDGDPRVTGHTIYRSLVPMDAVPRTLRSEAVTLWAGPGWHLVHYAIAGGSMLNVAAIRDDRAANVIVGQPVPDAEVVKEFAGLTGVPRRILDLGREWRRWVLCDRNPVADWAHGRVALLGDAAHPMLNYAAQGAAMALEDAVVLGRLLTPGGNHVERLRAYNGARRERAARAQLIARAMGGLLYHPAGAAARSRNERLRAMSADELHDRVAWLHGVREFDALGAPIVPEAALSASGPGRSD